MTAHIHSKKYQEELKSFSGPFWHYFVAAFMSLVLALLTLVFEGGLRADPPAAFLSYEDYQGLISKKLGEVPELKQIWSYSKRRPLLKNIYLSGSAFRGFLERLTDDLNQNGHRHVKKSPPADFKSFLPFEADKDMWAPDDVEVKLETGILCGWDVLGLNYIESIRNSGGSTLEWTAANPREVLDLDGGLRDYYYGRHVLRLNLSRIGLFNSGRFLIGNSNLALALRFIRTTLQMPSASPTEESRSLIVDHVAKDPTIYPPDNIFIEKALWRIFQMTGSDLVQTFTLLKEFGLLRVLGRSKFHFKYMDEGLERYREIAPSLKAFGFSTRDLSDARILLTPNPATELISQVARAPCNQALPKLLPR